MTPFFAALAATGTNIVVAATPTGGDDSIDIQAKLDQVGAGGIVFLNPATYNIHSTIVMNNNQHLISSGNAIIKAASDTLSAGLLLIHSCIASQVYGIKFDGDKANRSYSGYPNGINITNSSYIYVERCKVTNTIGTNILASSIAITGGLGSMQDKHGPVSNIYINENECSEADNGSIIFMGVKIAHAYKNVCKNPFREGIQAIDGSDDVYITYNDINTANTACIALEDHGERTGGDIIKNINITNNTLHASSDYPVYIDHANTVLEFLDISHNFMHSHQGACIGLNNDGFVFRDVKITHNKMYAQSQDSSKGIEFTYPSNTGIIENMDISHNQFRNCSIAFEKLKSNVGVLSYSHNQHFNCNKGVYAEKLEMSQFIGNQFFEQRGLAIHLEAGGASVTGNRVSETTIKLKTGVVDASAVNGVKLSQATGTMQNCKVDDTIMNYNGQTSTGAVDIGASTLIEIVGTKEYNAA